MIEHVEIMKFPHAYIIHPTSITPRGSQCVDPVDTYTLETPFRELTKHVLHLMKHSKETWPPDPAVQPQSRKMLRLAKVKRWRDFDPIAMVSITRVDKGLIELVPIARKGLGHSDIGGYVIRLRPPVSLDRLAKALAKAISISEASYRPKRRRK
ncbi:MAG: hypothetical protein GC164_08370 [Phycisphaera sp.]|nr:hypothetical protein [Phycisphaera sp.]